MKLAAQIAFDYFRNVCWAQPRNLLPESWVNILSLTSMLHQYRLTSYTHTGTSRHLQCVWMSIVFQFLATTQWRLLLQVASQYEEDEGSGDWNRLPMTDRIYLCVWTNSCACRSVLTLILWWLQQRTFTVSSTSSVSTLALYSDANRSRWKTQTWEQRRRPSCNKCTKNSI